MRGRGRDSIDPIRAAFEEFRISRNDRLGSGRGRVKLKRKVAKPKKDGLVSSTSNLQTTAAMFDDAEGDKDLLAASLAQSPVLELIPGTTETIVTMAKPLPSFGEKKRLPSEISPSPVLLPEPIQQQAPTTSPSLAISLAPSTTQSPGVPQRFLQPVREHGSWVNSGFPRGLMTPAFMTGISDDATVKSLSSSTTTPSLAESSTSSGDSGQLSLARTSDSTLSQSTGLYTQPFYPIQHTVSSYTTTADGTTRAKEPAAPLLYKAPAAQLASSRAYSSTQVDTSSSVPKAMLAAWYSVQQKFQISREQYVIWNNGALSHVLKFTCLFVCPLTGEIFRAAPYGDAVTVFDPQSKLVWFQKKAAAEHGAAAKAYDCYQFRRSLHNRDSEGRSVRCCRDAPAYLATGNEAESEADLIQEILTKWTPPESLAKIQQLRDRVDARQRAAQSNP